MPGTDTGSRDAILGRIRSALADATPSAAPEPCAYSSIFDPVADPLERFQQECAANLMECLLATDVAQSAQHLRQVLASLPPGEIFIQDDPTLRQLVSQAANVRSTHWSSEKEGRPAESAQATISRAEALIAQTGSVFVTAACGGRGASIVAPCHIVFATARQLVPDLETALKNASRDQTLQRGSFACVISGSSRTADIEKILVQGAHGPRRLVVILQDLGAISAHKTNHRNLSKLLKYRLLTQFNKKVLDLGSFTR
jgi:L-lactate dehydrogenase complex protein LldG